MEQNMPESNNQLTATQLIEEMRNRLDEQEIRRTDRALQESLSRIHRSPSDENSFETVLRRNVEYIQRLREEEEQNWQRIRQTRLREEQERAASIQRRYEGMPMPRPEVRETSGIDTNMEHWQSVEQTWTMRVLKECQVLFREIGPGTNIETILRRKGFFPIAQGALVLMAVNKGEQYCIYQQVIPLSQEGKALIIHDAQGNPLETPFRRTIRFEERDDA